MQKDSTDIEILLMQDSNNIEIDSAFKSKLKSQIIGKSKHTIRIKFLKYFSVAAASIALLVSIPKFGFLSDKHIIALNPDNTVNAQALYIKNNIKLSNLVASGSYFSPSISPDNKKMVYSSGSAIFEIDKANKAITKLPSPPDSYSPQYSNDGNSIIYSRNDGIYIYDIIKASTKKVIGSSDHNTLFERPSFTPDGKIIYFIIRTSPNLFDDTGALHTESSIYEVNKDGSKNTKIIDGSSPSLSGDNNLLAYENNDNIYILNLKTRENTLIDRGRTPSWSKDGRLLSFIKYDNLSYKYNKMPSKKNLFIDRYFSSVWIYDKFNPKNKYMLTEELFIDMESKILKWANEVNNTDIPQHFTVSEQYSYFETSWGNKSNELYVVRNNNEKHTFELIEFILDRK